MCSAQAADGERQPTAFLTGATGFIGIHVVRALVRRGWDVRCLVRPGTRSDLEPLLELGAHLVEGDLFDQEFLEAGMTGADLAIHLAGIYDLGPVDAALLERTNVEGTRVFLNAVEAVEVPRAVHVSSTVVYGPLPDASPADGPPASLPLEYSLMDDSQAPSVYHRTKLDAHRLALDAADRGSPIIIAAPAFVYGPGDRGPVGRMLNDLLRGRLPAIPSRTGWFSFAYVEDVGEGVALCGVEGEPGRTYVLGGETARLEDFLVQAARTAGRRPPPLRLPPGMLRATGSVLDVFSRLTGIRTGISREGVVAVTEGVWVHSSEHTQRDLGWSSRSLEQGLPPTVQADSVS